jgi:RNA polymerase sigma-70 factor (ECF subfamily)
MHTRGFSDDNLMWATTEGDEAAFAMLVQRHRGWVRNLLCAFTHDNDQAEDLAQEVFCRVLKGARTYCRRGQFTAWLKQIAVNVGRNYLAQSRRAALVSLSECEQVPAPSKRVNPAALLMEEALHTEIREAILALPSDQKRVILMRYFSGMTVQETARLLGCPEGTVKSRVHHALRRIRQHIQASEHADRPEPEA